MKLWSLLVLTACGSAPPPPATPSPAQELTIATWNVEFLAAAGKGRNPRTHEQLDGMSRWLRGFDADVIVLQEVSDVAVAESLLGSGWTVRAEERPSDQRVLIAVREGHEVAFSELEALAVGGGLRRGVVAEVDGVTVLGLHLKAGCQWDPLDRGEDCQTIGAQVEVLERWLDARAGEPVVLVGDFNRQLTAEDAVWQALDDGEPAGLALTAPLLGAAEACPGSRRRHPIDHLVVNGALSATAEQKAAKGSDHCPVLARVSFNGPTSPR